MLDKLSLYLKLIRFDKPVGTIILFLPIALAFTVLDRDYEHLDILLVFAILSFLMRSIGCIINDLMDMQYDRQVSRTKNRPLACGAISKIAALVLLTVLLCITFFTALLLKYSTLILGLLAFIPIILYPLMKRFFKYPQLFLGLTFNLGILIAANEITGHITLIAIILYFAAMFHTIAYDTIYAHQDAQDDLVLGLYSTAITFGFNNKKIIFLCYILFMFGILLTGLLLGYKFLFFVSIYSLFLYVFYLLSKWKPQNKVECYRLFMANIPLLIIINFIFIMANFYYV